jgi:hypothetical protein
VVVVVILKGTVASGFCSPAFTWAQAAIDARGRSNTALANFIVISPCSFKGSTLNDPGRLSSIVYHRGDHANKSRKQHEV